MKARIILLTFVLIGIVGDVASQCAMCKKVADDVTDEVDMSIGEQLNSGIVYLLIIPYIILFLLFRKKIFHMFREIRGAAKH